MLQAAALFGAGVLAKEGCAQLPACSAARPDGGLAFKLSVQVHAASVPALGEPGLVLRLKPRLSVGFGGAWKETEVADFVGTPLEPGFAAGKAAADLAFQGLGGAQFTVADVPRRAAKGAGGAAAGPRSPSGGSCSSTAGPWRFGDTLTFSAQLQDLLCGGVRLRLSAQGGMVLGPVQLELPRDQDMGEAVVDLRRRVLPACAPAPGRCGAEPAADSDRLLFGGGGRLYDGGERPPPWWETPVLMVPLQRVSNCPHSGVEVATVARVAVSFSVNSDPEALLFEVQQAERPLAERLVDRVARWLQAPLGPISCADCGEPGLDCTEAALSPRSRAYRPQAPVGPRFPEDEPEAEAAPSVAAPAAADWAFKL